MYISVIPIKQRAEALHYNYVSVYPWQPFSALRAVSCNDFLVLNAGNFSFLFTATKVLQAIL